MFSFVIAIFFGVVMGTITGLTPGIHINLVSIFLLSLSTSLLSSVNPEYLAIFVVALAITHTFVDFIPSVFLGCPDTDTELSILPGHELLKEGKGYEAVVLTIYGSLAATAILIFLSIPLIIFKQSFIKNYFIFQPLIPGFLILASCYLISLEHRKKSALLVFFLTGWLGLCVLNFNNLKEPLLPLLTGLFGSSTILLSIKNKITIPKQEIIKPKIKSFKPIIGATIAAPLCSLLPGLGSGQAAVIGNSISKQDKEGFLILLRATNTLVMGFSFISLYLISKTRTGAAATIQSLLNFLSTKMIIAILLVVLITGIIAAFVTNELAKILSKKISSINYTKLSFIILTILLIVNLTISGVWGLIILIVSTLTGIYCIGTGVKRTHMMGCLIIQTLFFYIF